MTELSPWLQPEKLQHAQLLLDAYAHWLGRDLVSRMGTQEEQAEALFVAPFVVVSHGTEADPILNYGNRVALTLWEVDWQTLVQTPSRQTAEPVHRDERAQLLARTTRAGYVDDYRGIRVSSTGQRFEIEQAIVWNLIDSAGTYRGQAATFSQWHALTRPTEEPAK